MLRYQCLELGRKGMDGSYVELGKHIQDNGYEEYQVFSWKPRSNLNHEEHDKVNEECMWDRSFLTEKAARNEFDRFK